MSSSFAKRFATSSYAAKWRVLRRTAQPACSGGSTNCSWTSRSTSGMPADRSLFSSTAQGSKFARPTRRPFGPIAAQRLDRHRVLGIELDRRRRGDLRIQRAEPHVEARLAQDRREPRDVLQVEAVARVVLGDQQQPARVGADLLDRRHRRLHRERHDLGCEVVEAPRIEVRVDRRDLEPGVAQVDRAVERRRVLLPLEPEPALDRRRGVEHAPLEVGERAGQRGDEVRDHGGRVLGRSWRRFDRVANCNWISATKRRSRAAARFAEKERRPKAPSGDRDRPASAGRRDGQG